ncbi:uncharacterized protein K444DRAFT_610409 [Hyaloscypha bicolor E]|uniref:Uncharacterized protein n=1 Tax=Hyaloscypha bicolor E TaxID=1095630 RepID=A0A2J6TH63_9HELO|nr:uncharacterized protein K444DRAFT_610409 [Hyaloscypha bicolor E]PMD62331.1 hypothetical protein K444DRAFT_610409 [Hyaloscypha bicolor E]
MKARFAKFAWTSDLTAFRVTLSCWCLLPLLAAILAADTVPVHPQRTQPREPQP